MPGKKIPEERRREQILEAAFRVALRERIAGLSGRAVAREAGVSSGLVFFHFSNQRELLLSLLDWLLAKTILRRARDRGVAAGGAAAGLAAEIRTAVDELRRDRTSIELFFDYWLMGARDRAIRGRIRAALKRYRDSYLPLARAAVQENPGRYATVTGEELADLVTSYIEGCALRVIADPRRHDAGDYTNALAALLDPSVRGADE